MQISCVTPGEMREDETVLTTGHRNDQHDRARCYSFTRLDKDNHNISTGAQTLLYTPTPDGSQLKDKDGISKGTGM